MKSLTRLAAAALAITGLIGGLGAAPAAFAQTDQQHGAPPGPAKDQHKPEQNAPARPAPAHVEARSQHAPEPAQHVQQNVPPAWQQHPADQQRQPPPEMGGMMPHQQTMVASHQWHHGDHFTGSRRVVTDWQRYRAPPPPAGYEYVQDGNQLVLIAVASGIIANVLANALDQ